ncbi:MAG: DUF3782 domain-containing protein [Chloroflexota bacterium]|nr:DUF3782 domain-containing protein [Chloroflexota bacterium]
MAAVTREEIPEIVREELTHLLRHSPPVRRGVIEIMSEFFIQRADLRAVLERIDAQGERIEALRTDFNCRMEKFAQRQEEHSKRLEEHSQRMEEFAQRQEEHSKRLEEHSQRMEEFAQRQEEHSKRLEEHSQRMEEFARRQEEHSKRLEEHSQRLEELSREIFALRKDSAQLFRAVGRLESTLGGIGARWGMMSESAFREGLAGILTEETGLRVEHYDKMDTEGLAFGRPRSIEVDVIVRDGEPILLELKSSVSWNDVDAFDKKVAFYEQTEGVEVERRIIISPMFEPRAEALAQELEMEAYTSAYDVRP